MIYYIIMFDALCQGPTKRSIGLKKRIWELDVLRGIFVILMVLVHLVYDLTVLYRLVEWGTPRWVTSLQSWGGQVFVMISGICATLGRQPVRRGLVVFGCGMIVTVATVCMYLLGMANRGIIIYFGVLHCLGVCMLLWPLFRRLPWWALGVLGSIMVALGLWIAPLPGIDSYWLMPLGLHWKNFYTSDYFPLLPNLGFFLLGAVLGRTVYKNKQSLLPQVNENNPILVFFRLCGKHSLFIYLVHQPILSGLCMLLPLLR